MRKTSDLRKAEIVATILGLADRIGPDRVTTGAVAIEVGVTQAAIFRHFPTKAAMWNAVADHVAEALTTAWDAALAQADLPVERVKALIGAQLDQIAATPAMPMLLFSRELNVENADLRAAFRDRSGHVSRPLDARGGSRAAGPCPAQRCGGGGCGSAADLAGSGGGDPMVARRARFCPARRRVAPAGCPVAPAFGRGRPD